MSNLTIQPQKIRAIIRKLSGDEADTHDLAHLQIDPAHPAYFFNQIAHSRGVKRCF